MLDRKSRNGFGSHGFAHRFATSGIEDPMNAKVDAADIVLFNRFLERKSLLPFRAKRTLVVDGRTIEFVGGKRYGNRSRRLSDQSGQCLKTGSAKRSMARRISWKVGREIAAGYKSAAARIPAPNTAAEPVASSLPRPVGVIGSPANLGAKADVTIA